MRAALRSLVPFGHAAGEGGALPALFEVGEVLDAVVALQGRLVAAVQAVAQGQLSRSVRHGMRCVTPSLHATSSASRSPFSDFSDRSFDELIPLSLILC